MIFYYLFTAFPRLPPNIEFKIITEQCSPEDSPYLESNKLSKRYLIISHWGEMANYI